MLKTLEQELSVLAKQLSSENKKYAIAVANALLFSQRKDDLKNACKVSTKPAKENPA